MTTKNKLIKTASFLYEIGTMRKIARSHRQTLLTDDLSDNIASHSYRVAWIGWLLANEERIDPYKVLLMCLSHDISEIRSGDQNWVHKRYIKVFENEITKNQINNLIGEQELETTIEEYEKRESEEAKIAKDADLIDQILLLKEYEWAGNKEARNWLEGKRGRGNMQYKLLYSKSAKKLADEILSQKPSDWWKNVWTEKRR